MIFRAEWGAKLPERDPRPAHRRARRDARVGEKTKRNNEYWKQKERERWKRGCHV